MTTDTFIHRWSQNKNKNELDDRDTDHPAQKSEQTDSQARDGAQAISINEKSDEAKEKVQIPPLELLNDDSDYSAFFSSEVDEGLRKLALRKLFKAPFYNLRDGLNDYDEDFTTFKGLGDIITSDMKFQAERKEAKAREAEPSQIADGPPPPEEQNEDRQIEDLAHEKTDDAGDVPQAVQHSNDDHADESNPQDKPQKPA